MPSRSIAVQLTVTLCWIAFGTPSVGLTTADAGPFFRSRPTQNYRDRLAQKKVAEKEETAADRYKAQFKNVETPPAAPRADTASKTASPQLPQLTGRSTDTEKMVDEAISRTKKRYLTVGEHTPWQILHGSLALRHEFLIRDGDKLVRSLDWLRNGMVHDGLPLIEKTEHGARCHPFTVPWAFEGHTNQFLAILSLSALPEEYQFRTPKGEIVTMGDMVRHAQKSMDGRGEMTWTLWFLSHYVEPDAEWETATGQFWSMERLVRMEARQKVNGAPCGGTHRLFALSLARNAYLAKHGNARGAWLEADQVIRKYVATIRSIQNRDGSFSSDWFKGRGYSTDLTTRLKTSGHALEWLMVALSDKQLDERWLQLAVQSVARDVIRSSREPAECGALYHALDALTFYKQRKHPTAVQPAASPTYLVPPSRPTSQQPQVVDAAPARTLPARPQTTFEQPTTVRPARPNTAIPRMVTAPDVGVRPLAGTSDSPSSATKPAISQTPKTNSLVVEEVDPLTGLAIEPTKTEPTLEAESIAQSQPTDAIDVPMAADTTPIVTPAPIPESPLATETAETLKEDVPALVVVPDDVAPLATRLPSKPDAEADPTIVESAEPSSEAMEIEPEENGPIEVVPEELQVAEEPTNETTAMIDGPASTDATATVSESPQPAVKEDATTAQPDEDVASTLDNTPRQVDFKARQIRSTEAEMEPAATTVPESRVELRRRQVLTPQVIITPMLPKLPAPGAPATLDGTESADEAIQAKKVAAEAQAPQAMNHKAKRAGGLIVIQIEDFEDIPILVPLQDASTIQRASATW